MGKGIHSFNDCFLHGAYTGDICPHPEHNTRDGLPPRDWWRNVPCGHPPDPIAWLLPNGIYTCHCGHGLEATDAISEGGEEGAPGPIVPCSKCGCYVALPASVPA